jgi:photosystem II stability/assembly factor-like uncharacterized protein
MKINALLLILTFTISDKIWSQTSVSERLAGFEQRKTLQTNSLVAQVPFKAVGPSIFSCRVTDMDINPKDPSIFYTAYASAGLWKSDNNGQSFKPIFDNEAVMTIGDIAVNWDKNIIWIGTGENNSSRSSYSGVGVYKSTDDGKTWQHCGLGESHHIGRIVLHPTNPDIAWVAALGHLYTPNKDRGIYKTIDGGKTWTQTLFVNENAGAIDLMADANNPDILYSSLWERSRSAWNFNGSGSASGIYKSIDGGTTWVKLNDAASGFPTGDGTGRIGLAQSKADGKTILFAAIDNNTQKKEEKKKEDFYVKNDFRTITKEGFLALNKEKLVEFLKKNDFPEKYSVEKVIEMVKNDKLKPIALVEFLEDANSMLTETEVTGAEVYRSDDGGKTWKKTHEVALDNVFYTYGYYFAQITAAPNDPNLLFLMGLPVLRSDDAGKTWKALNDDNVHGDHHYMWINPNRKGHIINGNDGGVNISYDNGDHFVKCNSPAVGQFYSINVDNATPYNIYGGAQDNGVWMGPSDYKTNDEWHGSGQYPYKMIQGGDGMQVQIDTRDNVTVYTGYQFGNYYRINTATGDRKYITPVHDLGERPYRWNWQTPILLSSHNQDIIYMGGNKLFRSFDKGNHFEAISGDLTTGGKKGNVAFSTITCIDESKLKFGLLYVGTDDGNIWVSKDAGTTWQGINFGLPNGLWVSRIQASAFDKGTVYMSLNGYRNDDFKAYLYSSSDYGATWKAIGTDLPAEPINVVREDPKNANILYVGTDHSVYISFDKGLTFNAFHKDLPAAPYHDLVVQARESDLILGSHGRSLQITSVKEIQQLTPEILKDELFVFDVNKKKFDKNWGKALNKYSEIKDPIAKMALFSAKGGNISIKIKTEKGLVLKTLDQKLAKGLNYLDYNLDLDEKAVSAYQIELNTAKKDKKDADISLKKADSKKYYLQSGKYNIELVHNGKTVTHTLLIEAPKEKAASKEEEAESGEKEGI